VRRQSWLLHDGNSFELSAACATSIMNQNVFNLKVIDDNTIKPTIEEPTSLSLPAA